MSAAHLAQVNLALPREPVHAPLLRDFAARLEPVNARADAHPGFVWRLQTEEGDATALRAFGDEGVMINMSVWESLEALRLFTYADPEHLEVMRRRRDWFHQMAEAYMALWWVPAGHRPTVREAEGRVTHLRAHGPTPHSFTFREPFPPPGPAQRVRSTPGSANTTPSALGTSSPVRR